VLSHDIPVLLASVHVGGNEATLRLIAPEHCHESSYPHNVNEVRMLKRYSSCRISDSEQITGNVACSTKMQVLVTRIRISDVAYKRKLSSLFCKLFPTSCKAQ